MDDMHDPRQAKALVRFQVIAPYLADDPPRGQRGPLRRKLARRVWTGPDGEPFTVSAGTIRKWVSRYRNKGLDGLLDAPRPRPGVQALTAEQVELVCQLKKDVPERSLDRIISIAEGMKKVEPGVLRRSTVHRVLKARGLSARKARVSDAKDLDRFEADAPNALWHSDLLVGPWLPDPDKPGKMRRAYLYAYLDDHSRLLLHGRFSFKGDLPALELVLRRALQKRGLCRRLYYDNAAVYRSRHMQQIVATLGVERIVYTRPYRPMGNGKIEALNRLIRSAFIAELKASQITTLDALNEAFLAWSDTWYNRRCHAETGQTPMERWHAGLERIRYVDDEDLRQAFLWKERRTPDKAGVFSLFGVRYQVGPEIARRRIEIRYDPEVLWEVEVWHDGEFVQRARPLQVLSQRRPRVAEAEPTTAGEDAEPSVDWLGHLVQQRQEEGFIEPSPRALADQARQRRDEADEAVLALLHDRLDAGVVESEAVRTWLASYGPLDPHQVAIVLDDLLDHGQRTDQHVTVILDAIHAEMRGGTP
jgi:putative transposase